MLVACYEATTPLNCQSVGAPIASAAAVSRSEGSTRTTLSPFVRLFPYVNTNLNRIRLAPVSKLKLCVGRRCVCVWGGGCERKKSRCFFLRGKWENNSAAMQGKVQIES